MKRALVTGGTGFVGSHVVDELLEHGYRVRVAVRATSDLRWLEGKAVELVEADLVTGDLGGLVGDTDVTFHLAGVTRGDARRMERANVQATQRLVDALEARAPGSRVVFCSSLAAVGTASLDRPLSGGDAPAPVNDYGRSKLAAERALLRAEAITSTILRPGGIYGPRDRDTLPFFQMAAKGLVVTPGLRRRQVQLVHCRDVARACRLAAEADLAAGRAYFVNHPELLEWPRIAEAMRRAVDRRALAIPMPSPLLRAAGLVSGLLGGQRPGRLDHRRARDMAARAWTADVEPAIRELGWRPIYDIDEGFTDTARWYREAGWL